MKDVKIISIESHNVPRARAPPIIEGVSKPVVSAALKSVLVCFYLGQECFCRGPILKCQFSVWIPARNTQE